VRELMTKELENGILQTTYADGDAADRFVETAQLTSSAFLLKTHASGTLVDTLIAAGRVAAIYTWRDPRDAIASHMDFLKSTFTESLETVTASLLLWHETHVQNGENQLWRKNLTEDQLHILEKSWLAKYFY
jgi:hypothetical protein